MRILPSRESVSRAVHGSIVTLAVLLVIERNPPDAWSASLMLLGTAFAVALAETFSKTVAEIIAGEEHLDARSLPAIWSKIRPILIAKVLVYSALFLLGPRVGAVRHGTRPRILVSGLFTDGIGGLISLVKMLCH